MKNLIWIACAIALLVWVVLQHRSNASLRAENDLLRLHVQKLDEENQTLLSREKRPETSRRGNDNDLRELMQLRGEVARFRRQLAELKRNDVNTPAQASDVPPAPSLAFTHPFLARTAWTNAGLETPRSALQTFLWAFTARNEAELAYVSARDSNGEPIKLTGKALDWQERLQGAQVLRYSTPDPRNLDSIVAVVLTQASISSDHGDTLTHDVMTFRFLRSDGQWRFAGIK